MRCFMIAAAVTVLRKEQQVPVATAGCAKCNIENLCAGQMNPVPGTEACLPNVCKAVCLCRQGLPEPPVAPPIAILPPPAPVWNVAQTTQFCACVGTKMVDCTTDLCRDKIKVVMDIVKCESMVVNAVNTSSTGSA